MFKLLLYFLSFFVIVFYVSCNKEKLKSPQASFLLVDRAVLTTTSGQGSNSHKITDMWLYVNDNFQGVFPVGSIMPIVAKDNADITLYAGIKNNGISATRIPYAFYKHVAFNQTLEAGKTYTYTPNFEYVDGLPNFKLNENFDGASTGTAFVPVPGSVSYTLVTDPSKTYGGIGRSLFMTMTETNPISEIRTGTAYTGIPTGGSAVYLELNYRCNQGFKVGVIGGGSDVREAITINPSEEWNKIYIQLTSVLSTQPTYTSYQIFITSKKEIESPEIYLDNVKLISF